MSRIFIEIDTDYGTITKAVAFLSDGKIDDVHKLQYTGSVMYDSAMKDIDKEFKRRVKDGVRNVGDTVQIQTGGRPERTAPFLR